MGTAGGRLAYAAAKAGILGLTTQLAKDVGEFGITVNAVMPWLTLSAPGTRSAPSSRRWTGKPGTIFSVCHR